VVLVAALLAGGPVSGPARRPADAGHREPSVSCPVTHAGRPQVSVSCPVADVGHRGASAYAPENTIAAFREAAARHADFVELDVQQTRDHRLIVMHDSTLARTTDAGTVYPRRSPWRVRDFTLRQIKRLDAGSWFAARYRHERVPTLGEALRALDGSGMRMLLEIKNPTPGLTRRIAARLRREPSWLAPGRLIVQSFDWPSVRAFHRLLPSVATAVLGAPTARQLPAVARYACYVNPRHTSITAAYVRLLHTWHFRVFAWVADDRATMRRLIADRVDGIISDRPDILRSVIREG
jgi:glycerophosphoryl diester phosphodiesterase